MATAVRPEFKPKMLKLGNVPADLSLQKLRADIPGFIHSAQKGKDLYVFNSSSKTQEMLKRRYADISITVMDSDSALYELSKNSNLVKVFDAYSTKFPNYRDDVLVIIRSLPSESSDAVKAAEYVRDLVAAVYTTSETSPINVSIRAWLRDSIADMKTNKGFKDVNGAEANVRYNVIRQQMRDKFDKAMTLVFHAQGSQIQTIVKKLGQHRVGSLKLVTKEMQNQRPARTNMRVEGKGDLTRSKVQRAERPDNKKPLEKKTTDNKPQEKKPYEKKTYEKKPYEKKTYEKKADQIIEINPVQKSAGKRTITIENQPVLDVVQLKESLFKMFTGDFSRVGDNIKIVVAATAYETAYQTLKRVKISGEFLKFH